VSKNAEWRNGAALFRLCERRVRKLVVYSDHAEALMAVGRGE